MPPDAEAFGKRLVATLNAAGVPEEGRGTVVGALYGLSKAAGNAWLRGASMPEAWRILDMAERWGVSFRWLYAGRGDMHDNVATIEASPPVRLDVLTMALEITDEFASLSPSHAHRARGAAAFYALLDQGVPLAEVRSFARVAGNVITGGGDAEPGGDGST